MELSERPGVVDLDVHLPGIVARDETAFGAWLKGAEGPVRRALRPFARRLDTEAVLQETMLRVWLTAHRIQADGRPNGLLRWAMRIAKNLAASELRRIRTDPVELEELERMAARVIDHEVERTADPGLMRVIRLCVDKLPAKLREAVTVRLNDAGRSRDEVLAGSLGIRRNTFVKRITRAREAIADCLRKHGVDPSEEMA